MIEIFINDFLDKEKEEKIKETIFNAIDQRRKDMDCQNSNYSNFLFSSNLQHPNSYMCYTRRGHNHTITSKFQPIRTTAQIAYDLVDNRNIYKFKSKLEKTIFKMNYIFPNDEEYMKNITSYDKNKILNALIEELEKVNQIEDEKKKTFTYNLVIKKFLYQNKEDIEYIMNCFKKYHQISNLEMIINRLAQIKYINENIYYKSKEKTLVKNN